MVLEKTLESPLDSKEIKPANPKGNESWIFTGRTDAEAEAPIAWPPDVTSRLIGKDLDAGKDWRQKEKGMTEDEMVGWQHQLNGHEFEQTPGDSKGQGSLVCVANSCAWLSNWTTQQHGNKQKADRSCREYTWEKRMALSFLFHRFLSGGRPYLVLGRATKTQTELHSLTGLRIRGQNSEMTQQLENKEGKLQERWEPYSLHINCPIF